jgi:hypothetical protein
MEAIQAFIGFMEGLENRIGTLQGEETGLLEKLAEKKETLREATIQGDGRAARAAVSRLEKRLSRIREEASALVDARDGRSRSQHMEKLRSEALVEIRETVAAKRKIWQEELRPRLEAKKAEFLELVELSGQLFREGNSLVGLFVSLTETMAGPKPGAPAFMTDLVIRPDRHVGAIFINPEESETSFRKGA